MVATPARSRRAPTVTTGALSVVAMLGACERTIDLGVDAKDGGEHDEDATFTDIVSPHDDGSTDGGSNDDGSIDDAPPNDGGEDPDDLSYVFVTRGTYPGDLGGIPGANLRCQSSATAAGLRGTYIAWISDGTVNASDRIVRDGPWREVGSGAVLFANRAAWQGFPSAPLARDETGQQAPERWWTGTAINGLRHPKTCMNWTSRSELQGGLTGYRKSGAGQPGKEWTEDRSFSCVFDNDLQRYALICLRN